jgi:hypothetical protein
LRIDNGMPWGSSGDLPTDLACWLAGLGVGLLTNPPRRPQANGVIERYQGVGKAWGEPHRCGSAAELQRRMNELDRWQRDLYPTAAGRPRRAVYPGLNHSGRRYTRTREATMWDLGRAWAWVGSHLVRRLVDSQGKVSLYNRPYTVGLKWSGREIWVGFDSERGEWMFQDDDGHEIRRHIASELSAERIEALNVTHRRHGIHAAKPHERTRAAQPTER